MVQPQQNLCSVAVDWPVIDRGDGRIEIQCPHGVGHPSHHLSTRWASWMGVHGCCNETCCKIATEVGRKIYQQRQQEGI